MTDLNIEIWHDIKNYEGYYQVSNFGNVKGLDRKITTVYGKQRLLKGKMMKLVKDRDGYLTVKLSKNNTLKHGKVHRLVAESFLDEISYKNEVNHIDGNKENNKIENLEWCTSSENRKHAVENRLLKVVGSENPMSKLNEENVTKIRALYNENKKQNNILKLATEFGVSFQTIWEIVAFKSWKHLNTV